VAVTGPNQVAVIDTRKMAVVKRLSPGKTPFWIAIPGNP